MARVGVAAFSAAYSPHATWQMFTVADSNTLHLFSVQASVHVHVQQQQQQQGGVDAGGFKRWVI